jgi:hypothetical protein
MWELRRLKTLWASTVFYRDNFTISFYYLLGCKAVHSWDSPAFREKYCRHRQGRKVNQEQTQLTVCFCYFLSWLTPRPWRWRRYVLRTLSELHGLTTVFTVTAVPSGSKATFRKKPCFLHLYSEDGCRRFRQNVCDFYRATRCHSPGDLPLERTSLLTDK